MTYKEDYRESFSAKCACGIGLLHYYIIYESNHWGQGKIYDTPIEITCDSCKQKYHHEYFLERNYLVPNGLEFPKESSHISDKIHFEVREKYLVDEPLLKVLFAKEDLFEIATHINTCRYAKDISNKKALKLWEAWSKANGRIWRRKLFYADIEDLIANYDTIIDSINQKINQIRSINEKSISASEEYLNQLAFVEAQSYEFQFHEDIVANQICSSFIKQTRPTPLYELDRTGKKQYDYTEHKNFVGYHWDTYYIEEQIDTRPNKYRCICHKCGETKEILASDMKVEDKGTQGHKLKIHCSCHDIPSSEAKAMDILNRLGIPYIRETTFEGLEGDSKQPLRFDIAICQSEFDRNSPKIDLLIEINGRHHYEPGRYDKFHQFTPDYLDDDCINEFKLICSYDELKKNYCSKHGIPLECIKYTNFSYDEMKKSIIRILEKYNIEYKD